MKTKVTFTDGSSRVLKAPSELPKIDKNREARFVMNNGDLFTGYCDGVADVDGGICIVRTKQGIGLPFNRLLGWCYTTN